MLTTGVILKRELIPRIAVEPGKRTDPLNITLAKAGIYGPLVQKQITSWANGLEWKSFCDEMLW